MDTPLSAVLRFRSSPVPHLVAVWDCVACRSVHVVAWPGKDPWVRRATVPFSCRAGDGPVGLRIPRWADRDSRQAWRRFFRAVQADGTPIRLAMSRQGEPR